MKKNNCKFTKTLFCLMLAGGMILSAGCQNTSSDSSGTATEETVFEGTEVQAVLGQEAEFGGMKLTVLSAEDPEMVMEDSGNMALFFQIQIDNQTENTVNANYLNNFSLTADGVEYPSDKCCTIPVMRKLYDFYGIDALNEEIAAGSSCTGYIACEVNKNFKALELHYTPKTTDRASRITVPITKEQIVKAEKNNQS